MPLQVVADFLANHFTKSREPGEGDNNPVQFRLQLAVVCESQRIKRDLNLNVCEELGFN